MMAKIYDDMFNILDIDIEICLLIYICFFFKYVNVSLSDLVSHFITSSFSEALNFTWKIFQTFFGVVRRLIKLVHFI